MNSVFVLNETAATGIFTYRHTRSLHDALPSSTAANPALSAARQALCRNIPGFPFVNKINGDAKSHLTNVQFNSAYDFGDVEAYAFGSYSKRIASAYENLRVPDRVIASPVLGVPGTLATPGELIPFPTGRSEERRVGKGGVRTCRIRGSP